MLPSMQTDSMRALASAKLEGISPAVLEALGLTVMIDFTVITNLFITLAVMVYITQQTVNALIKEETDGTIEFLYSRPVSRREIFFQKLGAHVASYLFMLLVYTLVTIAGYLSFSDYSFGQVLREVFLLYGSLLFVGLVFGTFVLGIMSVLIDKLDFLLYLSPMDWIKTQKLMSKGILPKEWLVGLLIILFCMIAGYRRYSTKDFMVE